MNNDIMTENSFTKTATFFDVYCLGVCTIMVGGLTFWVGLTAGLWTFIFSLLFMGTGIICLGSCMSEMIGLFPFSGGAYGFVRVSLGNYVGFLIGCFESIGNIIMVAATVIAFAQNITYITGLSINYEPFYWMVFYVLTIIFQLSNPRIMWNFIVTFAIILFVIIILYLVTFANAKFETYAINRDSGHNSSEKNTINNDIKCFVKYLPLAIWFYGGIETVPLACRDAINAKKVVPQAIMAVIYTMLVVGVLVSLCAASQYPGVDLLSIESYPLNYGFSFYGLSYELATISILPGNFISSFCLSIAFSRQICSMAESGLFSKYLKRSYKSPFGVYGAWYGLIVFGFVFVSEIVYLKHHQFFSEDEQSVLMIAYVMNVKSNRKDANNSFIRNSFNFVLQNSIHYVPVHESSNSIQSNSNNQNNQQINDINSNNIDSKSENHSNTSEYQPMESPNQLLEFGEIMDHLNTNVIIEYKPVNKLIGYSQKQSKAVMSRFRHMSSKISLRISPIDLISSDSIEQTSSHQSEHYYYYDNNNNNNNNSYINSNIFSHSFPPKDVIYSVYDSGSDPNEVMEFKKVNGVRFGSSATIDDAEFRIKHRILHSFAHDEIQSRLITLPVDRPAFSIGEIIEFELFDGEIVYGKVTQLFHRSEVNRGWHGVISTDLGGEDEEGDFGLSCVEDSCVSNINLYSPSRTYSISAAGSPLSKTGHGIYKLSQTQLSNDRRSATKRNNNDESVNFSNLSDTIMKRILK
eukprot:gene15292-20599_t